MRHTASTQGYTNREHVPLTIGARADVSLRTERTSHDPCSSRVRWPASCCTGRTSRNPCSSRVHRPASCCTGRTSRNPCSSRVHRPGPCHTGRTCHNPCSSRVPRLGHCHTGRTYHNPCSSRGQRKGTSGAYRSRFPFWHTRHGGSKQPAAFVRSCGFGYFLWGLVFASHRAQFSPAQPWPHFIRPEPMATQPLTTTEFRLLPGLGRHSTRSALGLDDRTDDPRLWRG